MSKLLQIKPTTIGDLAEELGWGAKDVIEAHNLVFNTNMDTDTDRDFLLTSDSVLGVCSILSNDIAAELARFYLLLNGDGFDALNNARLALGKAMNMVNKSKESVVAPAYFTADKTDEEIILDTVEIDNGNITHGVLINRCIGRGISKDRIDRLISQLVSDGMLTSEVFKGRNNKATLRYTSLR